MERLIGRIAYGTAGGRDFASLRSSIERITEVKAQLTAFTTGRLHELDNELDTLTDVAQSIRDTLIDEPPFSVREGGFIRKGYNAEVDRLHEILSGGKGLLADIETREKEKTGIRTLKIGYNKVFGYYIEVSNSFKDLVPDTYIRKQTLVNGERYITEELKNLEQEILTAGDRDKALEFEIFTALRESVTAESVRIQRAAGLIAELDTLCSLASVAVNNNYAVRAWTTAASSKFTTAATPSSSACSRTRSSSRTTPIWASARTAPPSSPAPTWPVSRPCSARPR